MTYTIIINEINEGNTEPRDTQLLKCEMNANNDTIAAQVMSDLLLSVSKYNAISTDNLNANLYKTQWINGI